VAHLYFECIHPFSDGNGRVGRAISEIALSQEFGHPALLSLSTTIHRRKKEYYDALSRASIGDLDITEWLVWFTGLVLDSQKQAKGQISFVVSKKWYPNIGQLVRVILPLNEGIQGWTRLFGHYLGKKTRLCIFVMSCFSRNLHAFLHMRIY
tara:strand:+ start:3022 stop:3477 length:456 start_codon:yes stop_codon:yes gene_type:complete